MHRRNLPLLRGLPAALAAIAAVVALAGCKPPTRDVKTGHYRAVVELPGGEVPFGLDIAQEQGGLALYLVNGGERVRVAATADAQGYLTANLPGEGNRLEARVAGDEIEGDVILSTTGGRTGAAPGPTASDAGAGSAPGGSAKKTKLRFNARLGEDWRFVEQPLTDNADFAGRWAVTFTDDDGGKTLAVAEFAQSFHTVTGTVRTAAWTQSSLAGDAHDEALELSLFDGTQAVLYRGKLNERGELVGECWSTSAGHARFVATFNLDATLDE